ncbi:MAG: tyrosine-type recombinase/integrase [Cetobacterium sp.]
MFRNCWSKKIRIHDLRHSHASLLIHLGVNPLTIARRLGHEKVKTTLNTYSHLFPNSNKEMMELLGKV